MATATSTLEKTKIKITTTNKYKVIMHNDDTTSFSIVIEILKEVFKYSEEEANAIALAIHKSGKKKVGEYSKSIAISKANKAMRMASEHGYNEFKVTVE